MLFASQLLSDKTSCVGTLVWDPTVPILKSLTRQAVSKPHYISYCFLVPRTSRCNLFCLLRMLHSAFSHRSDLLYQFVVVAS